MLCHEKYDTIMTARDNKMMGMSQTGILSQQRNFKIEVQFLGVV